MRVKPLRPVGAMVDDIVVDTIADVQVGRLRQLLAEHGVLIMPRQHTTDAALVRFLRCFGNLMFTEGERPVHGCPDLNEVTNVGRKTVPRSTFHTDTSYVPDPPAYTALRAVEVPTHGGATLFSNQYRAHAQLPLLVRGAIFGRSITHRVTGVTSESVAHQSARHRITLIHPRSHRPLLYVTTPQRCVAVSGLSARWAARLVQYLFDRSTRPDNVLRHSWAPGDVVMWDNRCVMHQADHSAVTGRRVMHRGMATDG